MDPALRNARRRAREFSKEGLKRSLLLEDALEKAARNRGPLAEVWRDFTTLIRLLKAWSQGRYRRVPVQTVTLALTSVIYFLNPLDVIPDFLLGVGLIDDVALAGLVIASIRENLDEFRRWESSFRVERSTDAAA